ncbi:MAG: hypothetical protein HYX33_02485 [Actinobacteria bacterium]|nr:hypothetical protein [Actinomycetota bacterium]
MARFARMVQIELSRTSGNPRRYVLEGIGSLRFEGVMRRSATAEAGTRVLAYRSARTAATLGPGRGRGRRHRRRYALADGDWELAVLDGKGWGRQPVRVSCEDPAAVEPGLLLFAAFVVRGLAEDAGSTAGAAAGTAAMGG